MKMMERIHLIGSMISILKDFVLNRSVIPLNTELSWALTLSMAALPREQDGKEYMDPQSGISSNGPEVSQVNVEQWSFSRPNLSVKGSSPLIPTESCLRFPLEVCPTVQVTDLANGSSHPIRVCFISRMGFTGSGIAQELGCLRNREASP